jgi:putative CocE/NonD family hydrolase
MKMSNPDSSNNLRVSIFSGDSLTPVVPGYVPSPTPVPFGTNVKGVYFDGYPQIIKAEMSEPKYKIKVLKDVMVPMRDGVRIAVDIYCPDTKDEKFPVILCWGEWGKDCQDIVEWMDDKLQLYFDSPFWDGSMEGCNYKYTVPRGYIHIIAEPRGIGNSEGLNFGDATLHDPKDIYDTVDWIVKQPWSNGKVCMMGPSSYSRAQLQAAQEPHPNLICIRPDEAPEPFAGEDFNGIWDPLLYNIHVGKHANDHMPPSSYKPQQMAQPNAFSMYPEDELKQRLQELLDDPDIKYNMKFYAEVRYPASAPMVVDQLLYFKHPVPLDSGLHKIKVPMYIGAAWNNRLYEWGTFEAYRKADLPKEHKKLILYPPMFPARPFCSGRNYFLPDS